MSGPSGNGDAAAAPNGHIPSGFVASRVKPLVELVAYTLIGVVLVLSTWTVESLYRGGGARYMADPERTAVARVGD